MKNFNFVSTSAVVLATSSPVSAQYIPNWESVAPTAPNVLIGAAFILGALALLVAVIALVRAFSGNNNNDRRRPSPNQDGNRRPQVPAVINPPAPAPVLVRSADVTLFIDEVYVQDGSRVAARRRVHYHGPHANMPAINNSNAPLGRRDNPGGNQLQRLSLWLVACFLIATASVNAQTPLRWTDNFVAHSTSDTVKTVKLEGVNLFPLNSIKFQDPCVIAETWNHSSRTTVNVTIRVKPCALNGQRSDTVKVGYSLNGNSVTWNPGFYVQSLELARTSEVQTDRFVQRGEVDSTKQQIERQLRQQQIEAAQQAIDLRRQLAAAAPKAEVQAVSGQMGALTRRVTDLEEGLTETQARTQDFGRSMQNMTSELDRRTTRVEAAVVNNTSAIRQIRTEVDKLNRRPAPASQAEVQALMRKYEELSNQMAALQQHMDAVDKVKVGTFRRSTIGQRAGNYSDSPPPTGGVDNPLRK